MPRKRSKIGTVYLLHFDRKISGHAGHYIGFSTKLEKRLEAHENGSGARLVEVATERGIRFELVRTWRRATRTFERQLKNRKNAARLCPICREDANARLREWRREKKLKEAA